MGIATLYPDDTPFELRTRVIGAFPDGKSALRLAAARLRHVAGTRWGSRRYLDMDRLREQDAEKRPGAEAVEMPS